MHTWPHAGHGSFLWSQRSAMRATEFSLTLSDEHLKTLLLTFCVYSPEKSLGLGSVGQFLNSREMTGIWNGEVLAFSLKIQPHKDERLQVLCKGKSTTYAPTGLDESVCRREVLQVSRSSLRALVKAWKIPHVAQVLRTWSLASVLCARKY